MGPQIEERPLFTMVDANEMPPDDPSKRSATRREVLRFSSGAAIAMRPSLVPANQAEVWPRAKRKEEGS